MNHMLYQRDAEEIAWPGMLEWHGWDLVVWLLCGGGNLVIGRLALNELLSISLQEEQRPKDFTPSP